jgi:hypothetical protein
MGDINVQEAKNIVECRKSSVTISGDVHRIDRRKLFSLNVQNTIHIFGEIAAKEASLLSEIKGRNRLSSWREYYSPIKGKTYGYAIISSIEDHINNHFAQDNLIRLCVSAKQHVDKLLSDEDIR